VAHWTDEIRDHRIAALEIEHGYYLELEELFDLFDTIDRAYRRVYDENHQLFEKAPGSSHNHQAWEGGYMSHLLEVLNIACQQYNWMSRARKMPFKLSDTLQVLFLHDLEKPFKLGNTLIYKGITYEATKARRKELRAVVIKEYAIKLTDEQENALEYVEGVPDSKYTPGERTMGELAAFCHCCDIISARLWHDKGRDVNLGSSRWE
jgi:hypothetical protein